MSAEVVNPETVEQHIRTCSERIANGVMVCDQRPSVTASRGALWAVTSTEPGRWPPPERTKKAARASVERIARRILRSRERARSSAGEET